MLATQARSTCSARTWKPCLTITMKHIKLYIMRGLDKDKTWQMFDTWVNEANTCLNIRAVTFETSTVVEFIGRFHVDALL